MIERLCVIGVGLIGGSVAKSAKKQGICREIVGYDRDAENLERAQRLSVIDSCATNIQDAVDGADFVVIATPVGALENILFELKPRWSKDTVFTDVGSTKVSVVRALQNVFGHIPPNFIPGHPIAGAESSGVEASIPSLFRDKRVIITPSDNSNPVLVDRVEKFWTDLGGTVSRMEVHHHDAVLAATSHLPHIVAYALTDMLGRKDENNEIFKYAAGGFKDFTRIASSDPTMWLDICLANRGEIVGLIEQMIGELDGIATMLKKDEAADLFGIFTRANSARKRFLDQYQS